MKFKLLKNNLRFVFIWIFIFYSILIYAGNKDFEGEISYRINYENGINKQVLEVLPKQSTLLIKNQKSYSYTQGPLGVQGIIYDHKKAQSITLLSLLSENFAIQKNKSEIGKDRDLFKIQKIKHTNESKIILGYSCRKIIVSAYIPKLDDVVDFVAFYTSALGNEEWINEADPIYHGVKGLLLEYEIQMGRVFMSMKAINIAPKKIPESNFKVPKNYKVVSPDELEKILKKQ